MMFERADDPSICVEWERMNQRVPVPIAFHHTVKRVLDALSRFVI
jgi:hypothetical protein